MRSESSNKVVKFALASRRRYVTERLSNINA